MLRLVSLGDEDKAIIEYSLMFLLNNNIFIETFFSIRNNDINVSASILVGLFKSLTFSPNIETIKNIVNSKNFFEYATHVNIYNLSGMIMSFAKQELPIDKQNRIKDIIDEEPSFKKKCLLLRLLYKCFTDERIKKSYIDYLTTHFLELDVYSIVDFVIDDWIKPTTEKIDRFIRDIISISNKQLNGVRTYPDPVETRLECVYILYIREIITDISILNDLAEGRPHLQFLLSPNDFDYSQVDFSNYLWKNFARRDKYMKLFVEHKESIIPGIKVKLKDGSASEVKKKILYGFLTKGQEVWNI